MKISRRESNLMADAGVASALAPNMGFAAEPGGQPGGPYPANFQKVHDGLIVIKFLGGNFYRVFKQVWR